jgi:hypothetical protein
MGCLPSDYSLSLALPCETADKLHTDPFVSRLEAPHMDSEVDEITLMAVDDSTSLMARFSPNLHEVLIEVEQPEPDGDGEFICPVWLSRTDALQLAHFLLARLMPSDYPMPVEAAPA